MVRWTTIILLLGSLGACGDDDTTPTDDAGTTDSGPVTRDAGTDAGGPVDAGRDAGPVGCTTGCEIVELVNGVDHVCARRENGEVLCWGGNGAGQLGDTRERHGDCTSRGGGPDVLDCSALPVVVRDVEASRIASTAAFQTCAITADSTMCWGLEDVAATGSDTRAERFRADVMEGFSPAAEVEASTNQTCARLTNGTVVCRGANDSGQLLAEGDEPRRMVEALMGLSDVVEFDFAVGGHFGCARTAETLRCWGSNQDGELGDGRNDHGTCGVIPNTYDCSRTPVEVSTLDATAIAQVELGSSFACALLDDGTVWCWGANALGQLGNGTTEASDEPVQIEGLTGVTQIALGPVNACALLDSGDVRCWGSNEEGQIGDGAAIGTHESCTASDTTVDCVLEPTAVVLEVDATFVSVGIQNGCVIGDDGEVYCWGWNDRRQLGQEDRERRTTPIAIAGLD